MKSKEEHIEICKKLYDGKCHFIHMGEEQGGEIMKGLDNDYLLYEVTWGGYIFEDHFTDVEKAVSRVLSWT